MVLLVLVLVLGLAEFFGVGVDGVSAGGVAR